MLAEGSVADQWGGSVGHLWRILAQKSSQTSKGFMSLPLKTVKGIITPPENGVQSVLRMGDNKLHLFGRREASPITVDKSRE